MDQIEESEEISPPAQRTIYRTTSNHSTGSTSGRLRIAHSGSSLEADMDSGDELENNRRLSDTRSPHSPSVEDSIDALSMIKSSMMLSSAQSKLFATLEIPSNLQIMVGWRIFEIKGCYSRYVGLTSELSVSQGQFSNIFGRELDQRAGAIRRHSRMATPSSSPSTPVSSSPSPASTLQINTNASTPSHGSRGSRRTSSHTGRHLSTSSSFQDEVMPTVTEGVVCSTPSHNSIPAPFDMSRAMGVQSRANATAQRIAGSRVAEQCFRMFDPQSRNRVDVLTCFAFLSLTCLDPIREVVRFLFQLYDFNHNDKLNMEEVTILMQTCARVMNIAFGLPMPTNQSLGELTNEVFSRSDTDCSNDISLAEFLQWVSKSALDEQETYFGYLRYYRKQNSQQLIKSNSVYDRLSKNTNAKDASQSNPTFQPISRNVLQSTPSHHTSISPAPSPSPIPQHAHSHSPGHTSTNFSTLSSAGAAIARGSQSLSRGNRSRHATSTSKLLSTKPKPLDRRTTSSSMQDSR